MGVDSKENFSEYREKTLVKGKNIPFLIPANLRSCLFSLAIRAKFNVMVWKALNTIDRLLSQVTNILSNKIVEINNDNRSVSYATDKKFDRRSGSELSGAETKIIDPHEDKSLPSPTAQADIKIDRGER